MIALPTHHTPFFRAVRKHQSPPTSMERRRLQEIRYSRISPFASTSSVLFPLIHQFHLTISSMNECSFQMLPYIHQTNNNRHCRPLLPPLPKKNDHHSTQTPNFGYHRGYTHLHVGLLGPIMFSALGTDCSPNYARLFEIYVTSTIGCPEFSICQKTLVLDLQRVAKHITSEGRGTLINDVQRLSLQILVSSSDGARKI